MSRSPRISVARTVIRRTHLVLLLSACFLPGCQGFVDGYRHGSGARSNQDRMLAASVGDGARQLELELRYDRLARAWVEEHGTPDYLYVLSRKLVHFLYLADDQLVTFTRTFGRRNRSVVDGIPKAMLALVAEAEHPRPRTFH